MQTCKNAGGRLLRCSLKLQEYDFRTEYIKGELNVADVLSRRNQVKVLKEYSDDEKREILKNYHTLLGHGSPSNMNFNIRHKYIWPQLGRDIKKFCNECEVCQRNGFEAINTKNRIIESKHVDEIWMIDLLGPIGCGKSKGYVIVVIDHYSKYIRTKVTSKKTETNLTNAVRNLLKENGSNPLRIVVDCGKEFDNGEFKGFCRRAGIELVFSSPHHHKTTGAVERAICTYRNKLRKMAENSVEKWQHQVPGVTKAMNMSFHRAIDTSPDILRTGQTQILPIDKQLGVTGKNFNKEALHERISQKRPKYRKEIEKGKVLRRVQFKIGDRVYLFRKASNKMASNWHGGYVIVRKIHENAYEVKRGGRILRANKVHLKLQN